MLSKEASHTIFWAFGMTQPEIEPQSSEPLANTLPTLPMGQYSSLYVCLCIWTTDSLVGIFYWKWLTRVLCFLLKFSNWQRRCCNCGCCQLINSSKSQCSLSTGTLDHLWSLLRMWVLLCCEVLNLFCAQVIFEWACRLCASDPMSEYVDNWC